MEQFRCTGQKVTVTGGEHKGRAGIVVALMASGPAAWVIIDGVDSGVKLQDAGDLRNGAFVLNPEECEDAVKVTEGGEGVGQK